MSLTELFIRRPVATTLLSLGLALLGIVAFNLLPVSPLPQVDYPTISIRASFPGANPENMASTIATPLERSLGRIAGISEMTSYSSLGRTNITIQFDLGKDINEGAREVQAAINAARSLLPSGMPNNPTYRKVNPADAPILILALTSETMTTGQMYDIGSTLLSQKLSQIEGIGEVTMGGGSLPAVRAQVNPTALTKYGLSFEDIRHALTTNNANKPKGAIDGENLSWSIQTNDQIKTAAEFAPTIVTYRNGIPVRLSDIATVTDSVENERNIGQFEGKNSVLLMLFRQSDANIIDTIDRVYKELPGLRALIPGALDLSVTMDRSPSIRGALLEVENSLLLSIALVILVVFLFLRKVRATLIPAVAVPLSLLGTFAVMYVMGFSLNQLSLMALIVATGFVVDDAIVVLENVTRYIEAGESPMQAAIKGSREVCFTVISISLSLVAVFIPLLLMSGIVGRLFREFSITLAAAVLISMVISLTTTPMMCAFLLKGKKESQEKDHTQDKPGIFTRIGRFFAKQLSAGYAFSLNVALNHSKLMIMILLGVVALNVYLYIMVPKGFFPEQDIGRLRGSVRADQNTSFQTARDYLITFGDILKNDPDIASVSGHTTGSGGASFFVVLKPLKERTGRKSAREIATRIRNSTTDFPGGPIYLTPQQDIRVGGRQSDSLYQFTLLSDNLADLRKWVPELEESFKKIQGITDVTSDQRIQGKQTYLTVNRDAAIRWGVDFRAINSTLNSAFGQRQVATIYNPLNQYRVVLEAASDFLESPEALKSIYVENKNGHSVPLSNLCTISASTAPLSVNHQAQFASATISFNLTEGYSLSTVAEKINKLFTEMQIPTTVRGSFQGTAKAYNEVKSSQILLIITAIIAVYIVLGILYESYIHPITILSTLPSAGVGALLALILFKTEFTVIALIGVVLLIGIVKKNAIMMIDFAIAAERNDGLPAREAIFKACMLRIRPILMTTLAALFGAVPLVLGRGDGAETRQPLGIAIIGGLVVSQLLTLYTTPVVYLYMDRFQNWCRRKRPSENVLPTSQVPEEHPVSTLS